MWAARCGVTVTAPARAAVNPMRTNRAATIQQLRRAIDCLPHDTKVAMLEGIRRNEIIVGAYARDGGICPMLAAHRCGGRTSLIAFARAWDRFAFARGSSSARRATERELRVLIAHLEASLAAEEEPSGFLATAICEHRELVRGRARRAAEAGTQRAAEAGATPDRPGDLDRAKELRDRPGWSWMRVVRRLDDFERALSRLDEEHRGLPQQDGPLGTSQEEREALKPYQLV